MLAPTTAIRRTPSSPQVARRAPPTSCQHRARVLRPVGAAPVAAGALCRGSRTSGRGSRGRPADRRSRTKRAGPQVTCAASTTPAVSLAGRRAARRAARRPSTRTSRPASRAAPDRRIVSAPGCTQAARAPGRRRQAASDDRGARAKRIAHGSGPALAATCPASCAGGACASEASCASSCASSCGAS